MKITNKRNKITVIFEKKTDCLHQGKWVSDGAIMINLMVLSAIRGKIVFKNEEVNKSFILGEDFTYRDRAFSPGCDIDFNSLVNRDVLYDLPLQFTGLMIADSGHDDHPVALYHAIGRLNGITGIDAQYSNIVDVAIRTSSRNHLSWMHEPLAIYTEADNLLALLMPCKLLDTPELDAICNLHTTKTEV